MMFNLIDSYLNELYNTPDFKRLLELKKIIDDKYGKEIVALKTNEAKYLELKGYGDYTPGLNEAKKAFLDSKTKLYSNPEVKSYFILEGKIQNAINKDINEIKSSISNKFKQNKSLFLDL